MYLYEILCKECANRFAKLTQEKGVKDIECPQCKSKNLRILRELYLSTKEDDWGSCGSGLFG